MRRAAATLVVALAGCSPVGPENPHLPTAFPDLTKFSAVNPADYTIGGGDFVTPNHVSCALDSGPQKSIVCSGDIPGMPVLANGTGCPVVRKPAGSPSDSEYRIAREKPDCAPSRWTPLSARHKLTKTNGTCAVGDDQLVACIDRDSKHGFVLQPAGSWTF